MDYSFGYLWPRWMDWNLLRLGATMVSGQESNIAGRNCFGGTLLCVSDAVFPTFDAYDCPAIVLGGDADSAREMRAVLQSLGFDVLAGASHLGVDDMPVFIVLGDFLDQKENRLQLQRMSLPWPSAPVISISNPADAAGKLIPLLS
ncbi:hypothetical protein [Tabrizicola sp.]|uniref:hypothetical protein n=1 Tax=Tabrizicola sp. TaxID=2005166 RepID=UPI0027346B29|nr:hypothetical protein [Tabrizicola sp.]MDP3196182.1 hypothetical protein [Tabrizicola sp.]MDZ4068691.1 hypothetical protein [Tabrizicola sp.]